MESAQPGLWACTGGRHHFFTGGSLSVLLHNHTCPLCGSSMSSTVLYTSPALPLQSVKGLPGRPWVVVSTARGNQSVLFLSPSILGLRCCVGAIEPSRSCPGQFLGRLEREDCM